ncbi:MAG TPA: DoxX family protein [Flavisolibacter sp.]|jgi:putative oxidoreductase|nr:DoxX family protein [Flavisolibacter sp.]
MNKLFATNTKSLNNDLALLVGRIAIAFLMLAHGIPKMQMLFSGDTIQFPSVFGMSAGLSLALAVFAEVFCSILILVGFATRLATVPLIITMLVAVFSILAAEVFAKKELAVLYLSAYVVLFFAGSGKYSVDQILQPKPEVKYHPELKPEDPTLSIYQ